MRFLVLACLLGSCASIPEGPAPIQVFLLAGQSNMEGQAVYDLVHEKHYNGGRGTLIKLLEDAAHKKRMGHLLAPRDDVFVWYRKRDEAKLATGPLAIGFAVYDGGHHYGPELQFGHVVGDAIEAPVVLIKTAWGGKSLVKDFRPPSAGGTVGPYYTRMLRECDEALGRLGTDFPQLAGRPFEVAGFVWFQGWNDMFAKGGVEEYAQNLRHLVHDVRAHFDAPELPVVVGETGNANNPKFHAEQAKIAAVPHVRFVATKAFLRNKEDSPNIGHGHHWFGNAESYFLIGEALGEAMLALRHPGKAVRLP